MFPLLAYILLRRYGPLVPCSVLSRYQTGLPTRRFQTVWKGVPPRLRPGCRKRNCQNGGGMDQCRFENMRSFSCSSCSCLPDMKLSIHAIHWELFLIAESVELTWRSRDFFSLASITPYFVISTLYVADMKWSYCKKASKTKTYFMGTCSGKMKRESINGTSAAVFLLVADKCGYCFMLAVCTHARF